MNDKKKNRLPSGLGNDKQAAVLPTDGSGRTPGSLGPQTQSESHMRGEGPSLDSPVEKKSGSPSAVKRPEAEAEKEKERGRYRTLEDWRKEMAHAQPKAWGPFLRVVTGPYGDESLGGQPVPLQRLFYAVERTADFVFGVLFITRLDGPQAGTVPSMRLVSVNAAFVEHSPIVADDLLVEWMWLLPVNLIRTLGNGDTKLLAKRKELDGHYAGRTLQIGDNTPSLMRTAYEALCDLVSETLSYSEFFDVSLVVAGEENVDAID